MSFKKRIIFFVVGIGLSLLTYSLVFAEQANAQTPAENERILAAVKDWVVGRYDSSEQYQRDIDTGASDTQQHRLMYQLFAP
ncbi:MAG: hypothetical protein HN793_02060, partial [Rhodospirillaceae bacterium]|nr:hypothetical protein [Rhodospirillaceae bacterium]